MSSLNDGSGPPTSQNDSIPLDDEGSSMSIYSDEEQEGEYEPSDELSDVGRSSLDYSSVSRTYLSQSQSRGALPQSEDYIGTASYYSNGAGESNSYGYDDEGYEYSSGYNSMTYGDTSLRSPYSELSSTFASFYYENELVVKARSTLHFLRRPLYYFAFATAGSSAVGSVFRLATTVVKRHLESNAGLADASLGTLPGRAGDLLYSASLGDGARLPSGYPDVPAWLQEVRASLPRVMEVPAKWLLRRHNIPVLSDIVSKQQKQLQQAQPSMISGVKPSNLSVNVSSGVQEMWQSWQKTGPAIPVALFLPLFSIVAIKVAQHVRPNPHSLTTLLRTQQDAEDAEAASAYLSMTSPTRPISLNASPIAVQSSGAAAAPSALSSAGNTSVQSNSMDVPPTSRGSAPPPPPQVPPVDIAGARRAAVLKNHAVTPEARQPVTGADMLTSAALNRSNVTPTATGVTPSSTDGVNTSPRERSRSTTQAPQTHRHVADGELEEDVDVDTGASMEVSPFTAADGTSYDPAAKRPSPPQDLHASGAAAPPSVAGSVVTTGSSVVAGRLGQQRGSTLRGDVVVAVAGTPDVREANVAVIAAARYGCSSVLLPESLERAVGLLEAPPSLVVEFVNDVVASAMSLADLRRLTLVGVTAQRWDTQSLPLDTFAHPVNSLYLFVSHEAENPAAVATVTEVVRQSVFLGTSLRELPANQVFYDRLQKEKASGATSTRAT